MAERFKKPARYNLGLNPYVDARYTYCPKCAGRMGQRKLILLIHVEPRFPFGLYRTCRYCSRCDLLIVHQDEIQQRLQQCLGPRGTPVGKDDFLILGTLDGAYSRRGMKAPPAAEVLDYVYLDLSALGVSPHDPLPAEFLDDVYPFKTVLEIKDTGDWMPREPGKRGSS